MWDPDTFIHGHVTSRKSISGGGESSNPLSSNPLSREGAYLLLPTKVTTKGERASTTLAQQDIHTHHSLWRGQGAWAYLPIKHCDVVENVVVEHCGDACAEVHHDVGVLGTVHWREGGAYMHDYIYCILIVTCINMIDC